MPLAACGGPRGDAGTLQRERCKTLSVAGVARAAANYSSPGVRLASLLVPAAPLFLEPAFYKPTCVCRVSVGTLAAWDWGIATRHVCLVWYYSYARVASNGICGHGSNEVIVYGRRSSVFYVRPELSASNLLCIRIACDRLCTGPMTPTVRHFQPRKRRACSREHAVHTSKASH